MGVFKVGLERDGLFKKRAQCTNAEQNKKSVVTSDFNSELKIDLRLLAAAGNLMVGDKAAAGANWKSYADETKRGTNITHDALTIPLVALGKTIIGDVDAMDAIFSTGKSYQNLYQLAYNPIAKATDFAGEGKLVSYDGKEVTENIGVRYANGLYDRENDTVGINQRENETDSELAGTLAHEGAHRFFANNGQSYTASEEEAAHMVGDFVQSRWNVYQSDNTTLRASLPTATNESNNYANTLSFSQQQISPYQKDVHKYLTLYLAENAGFNYDEARQIAKANYGVDKNVETQPLTFDWAMNLFGHGHPKEDYHFTTPERREELKRTAYGSHDLNAFGEYLHAFQDQFSHQKDGVPYESGMGHLQFAPDLGEGVDKTYNRPELADQMARATYVEMQNFLKEKDNSPQSSSNQQNQMSVGQAPVDNWNQVSGRVWQFNRTRIEDNNTKGRMLFTPLDNTEKLIIQINNSLDSTLNQLKSGRTN